MDAIYKVLEDCEVKKLGERQYEFTASTAEMDRDGEVIDVDGWDLKNFKKNPVIMYAHDYRTLPIGKATKIGVRDGKLKNTVEFPPEGIYEFADIVERLVGAGYLKTESVGFIPRKWEDGDGEKGSPRRTYTKQELLEISIVPIPSNPNALMDAVEAGVITTKQFETIIQGRDGNVECDDGVIIKPEETDQYIRIPAKGQEGKHDGHRIRTIDIDKDKGIKALYCGECKTITTYLFDKDKGWTMAKARAWVKEHEGKSLNELIEHSISQEEIIDEFDYLNTLIVAEGISDKAKNAMWTLVTNILRISGSDIPVYIKELVSPIVETKPKEEILTQSDISEAIKRIAKTKNGG